MQNAEFIMQNIEDKDRKRSATEATDPKYNSEFWILNLLYSSTFFLPQVNIGNKNEITEAPIQNIAADEKS